MSELGDPFEQSFRRSWWVAPVRRQRMRGWSGQNRRCYCSNNNVVMWLYNLKSFLFPFFSLFVVTSDWAVCVCVCVRESWFCTFVCVEKAIAICKGFTSHHNSFFFLVFYFVQFVHFNLFYKNKNISSNWFKIHWYNTNLKFLKRIMIIFEQTQFHILRASKRQSR